MNERIKQLAEQAITEKLSLEEFIEALKKEPNDFYGFRVSELQKFAQLIVKECSGFRNELGVALCTDPGALHRYFGVEE